MISDDKFDYIIIGSGVAGLHVAYQFSENKFFDNKRIAIVDRSIIPKSDRILSFWEKNGGAWDTIVHGSWNSVLFKSADVDLNIHLEGYTYKSLYFKEFSSFCLDKIKRKSNFYFFEEEILSINEKAELVQVQLTNSNIKSSFVFDSRISEDYFLHKNNFPSVIQSFKGWEVVFEEAVFDERSFTMMDYRYQWNNSNSFMYILPSSNKKALLEYTFFAPFTILDDELGTKIKGYLETFFPNKKYTISATEAGEIPMTSYPFLKENTKKILKIGTAGGWVKASTGYSFKFAEKNALLIVDQIIRQVSISGYKQPKRFKFYDKLFIKVLQNQNAKGPKIFEAMYAKVRLSALFRFLDEETSLKQEIGIILKLPYRPFLKALFQ